jgi:hypothetical protein
MTINLKINVHEKLFRPHLSISSPEERRGQTINLQSSFAITNQQSIYARHYSTVDVEE